MNGFSDLPDLSPTIKSWNALSEVYADRFDDLPFYFDSYQYFLDRIPEGSDLFEIGCGPGTITRFISRSRPDLTVIATDAAPAMVDLARNRLPGAEFRVLDARNLDTVTGSFSGIVCGFCLPYLSREESAAVLKEAARLLNPNGHLYVSVMEEEYSNSAVIPGKEPGQEMAVFYYTKAELKAMLTEAGFTILKDFRLNMKVSLPQPPSQLILIAQKTDNLTPG